MKIKTSELSGTALDWAVAKADDLPIAYIDPFKRVLVAGEGGCDSFSPSTNWSQCGPLIEKYNLSIIEECGEWCAIKEMELGKILSNYPYGETYLIAACRAIVASRLGDEVEVPEELA